MVELDTSLGGVELVDAPLSIAKSPDPARAARASPEASIVQAARAVAGGRAQALVCAGGTGAALAAGLFNIKRARGIHRPALALALPVPGHPVTLLDVGANAAGAREHLVQFAFMGAALARVVLGVRAPPRGAALQRRGAGPRQPTGARHPRATCRPGRATRAAPFASSATSRVAASRRASPTCRHRRLHRQRRAEGDRGCLAGDAARDPRRRDVSAPRGSAARCCARRCATFARRSTPRARAAPTCWGCGGWGSWRTGASPATASRGRSCARARGAGRISWAHPRGARGGGGAATVERPVPSGR